MKPEMTITVNLEPSPETVAAAKMILELWINADSRRNIIGRERYTEAGEREVYLELKEGEAT
jgi:hypothetical protein